MMKTLTLLTILTACSLASASDWSVAVVGNNQDDIVGYVGYGTTGWTAGLGGGIWRNKEISSDTDITIGPFLSVPMPIPGNPFGKDLVTFVGVSPQIDLDTFDPILEFFAGAKLYADKKASPIIGARYHWITNNLEATTDINDGLELFGGLQISF